MYLSYPENIPATAAALPAFESDIQNLIAELHHAYLMASDVHQLGRILVRMLCGPPFRNESAILLLLPDLTEAEPDLVLSQTQVPIAQPRAGELIPALMTLVTGNQGEVASRNEARDTAIERVRRLMGVAGELEICALKQKDTTVGIVITEDDLFPTLISVLSQHFVHLAGRLHCANWAKSRGYTGRIVGKSPELIHCEQWAKKVAKAHCPVLITGETGSGKELLAQLIHFHSSRRKKPFIAVNCGAFTSDELLASELFGHVRGAFTDAKSEKKGKFELADGGTLFLDEVACMRPSMQSALLRTLRYGEIHKVGDDTGRRLVNVRVIAATNESLPQQVKAGVFRADLYSRLHVAEVPVPPVSRRKEDIPLLAQYFLGEISRKNGGHLKSLSPEALDILTEHHWTDNVAGLQGAVLGGYLRSDRDIIDAGDLWNHDLDEPEQPASGLEPPHLGPLAAAMAEFEAKYVNFAFRAECRQHFASRQNPGTFPPGTSESTASDTCTRFIRRTDIFFSLISPLRFCHVSLPLHFSAHGPKVRCCQRELAPCQ